MALIGHRTPTDRKVEGNAEVHDSSVTQPCELDQISGTMAEELCRMREDFVSSVSEPVVYQLLEDLLDGEVIIYGEADTIIKENGSTANQAGKLIDLVTSKGDDASNMLMLYLQQRHSNLYTHLSEKCAPPVEPAAGEPQDQSDESDSQGLKEDDFYLVTSESLKNRVALLITNINFKAEKNRDGAQKDEETMKNLLSSLEYEVVKHTDLTAKQMDEELVKFSKHPKLKDTDSVFVVIMSHGKRGAVCGVDFKPGFENSDELSIDDIFTRLNTENCPELLNRPKIIIIQACRGGEPGSVRTEDNMESDSSSEVGTKEDGSFKHKEKDFIALLSSTPGTVSYRDKSDGSIMIQLIDEVFKKRARKDHIEELFRKVMKRFEEEDKLGNRRKQMATKERCSLTRLFKFFP